MSWMRACRASVGVRVVTAALVFGATMPVQADPAPSNTSWTGNQGSGSVGSWGLAGNWLTDVATNLVPDATLDAILEGLIERDLDTVALAREGHDPATVDRIWRLLEGAEYKRRQAPPGVKITSRNISRERRYPIVNGFRG